MKGDAGADTLNGGTEADYLYGGSGPDLLNGGAEADKMKGDLGNDTYVVDDAGDVVTETSTLANEIDQVDSSVSYTLGPNVENLTLTLSLTPGASNINGTGNALDNVLIGNIFENVLDGGFGDDTLQGGGGGVNVIDGKDSLTGGPGRDIFKLITREKDTITDFSVADDTIQLENNTFTKLTVTGGLSAANFKLGAAATDADDYVIYNSGTGALFYDANGSGAGAAIQIAVLGIGLGLTHADFFVV